ncbi:adenosylcobalamin-dependent ribonucleoside-diphosphate reductase [Candidatus Woesearchaeota archaeon]|nr:adenosylcobalamin-dependent ribonucleoside-diphosphate reductase [Candidatus Woesearchaeota archaeon]
MASRKHGNRVLITIPKETARKNKINLKSKLSFPVSKNAAIMIKNKMPKLKLSKNALIILEQRYLKKNAKGRVIEKPEDMFRRVARNIASADSKYRHSKKDVKKTEDDFYNLMISLDFLPNSPTLLNAGRKLQQLAACFVLPIEDNINSIFKTLHDAALIHKTGAGTGFNFSRLRPKGDIIESAGFTSGPVSFMKIFDAATEQIKLGGTLRGANMGILNVDHPDVGDFITVKSKENVLTNFNVSVAITDKFMQAVRKNKNYNLVNPKTKKAVKKESARMIFKLICGQAWLNGDPGVIFIDAINRHNPIPKFGKIESTDSCGEQPLLPYESCNLGSINLSNFANSKKIDYVRLRKTVHSAIHFLDNAIDMCRYPLKENRKIVEKNRKIGLGVMGLADMLIKLNTPYDSEDGLKTAEEAMRFISEESKNASSELAKKRGTFPSWKKSSYGNKIKLRNATTTTIAPTGTISIIADVSSGIEPLFALSYSRKTAEGNILTYFNENLKKALIKGSCYNDDVIERVHRKGTIKNIPGIPEKIKGIFKAGSDIGPEWHVKMQAAFQKYVDNGISKTVTLPKDATVEDAEKIFMMAYELGCKGISIYRFGSREGQVIYLSSKRDEQITLKDFFRR